MGYNANRANNNVHKTFKVHTIFEASFYVIDLSSMGVRYGKTLKKKNFLWNLSTKNFHMKIRNDNWQMHEI